MYKILVDKQKYVVVSAIGQTVRPVRNWKQLAPAAQEAIRESTSSPLHRPGLYDCPAELAAQAR